MRHILIIILLITTPSMVMAATDGGITMPDTYLEVTANPVDIVGEVKDVVSAVKDYRSADRSGSLVAIAAILAAVFKILLSVLKASSSLFKNKAAPKIAALSLGLLIYGFSSLALDMPWYDAIVLAGSGPGAIVVNEIMKLVPALRKKEDEERETG